MRYMPQGKGNKRRPPLHDLEGRVYIQSPRYAYTRPRGARYAALCRSCTMVATLVRVCMEGVWSGSMAVPTQAIESYPTWGRPRCPAVYKSVDPMSCFLRSTSGNQSATCGVGNDVDANAQCTNEKTSQCEPRCILILMGAARQSPASLSLTSRGLFSHGMSHRPLRRPLSGAPSAPTALATVSCELAKPHAKRRPAA